MRSNSSVSRAAKYWPPVRSAIAIRLPSSKSTGISAALPSKVGGKMPIA
jgi:hypothetical protein